MLRRFAFLALALTFLSAPIGPSFAQDAPDEDPDEMDEPAQPSRGREARGGGRDREANRDAVRRRAAACRRQASQQNLRGSDARDAATICLAEARFVCLKRAVEAKVDRAERQDYINKCLGET